jgi:hypothetical protein
MTTNPKSSTAPAAGAAPDDPIFHAMAALEHLKIHAGELEAAHSGAEDAVFAARKENAVIVDGEEMRELTRRSTLISSRHLASTMKSNSASWSKDFARATGLTPNAPNLTWRARPLMTN